MTKVEYIMPDDQETYPDDAKQLDRKWMGNAAGLAERAAEQYYDHGGHEDWHEGSEKFELFFDGKSQGVFEVDLDFNTEFTARDA